MVLARGRGALPADPLADPTIERLSERFLELHREGFRTAVNLVVELGQILLEAKPRLRGSYARWLDRLGVSPQTARNYESLAQLSARHPGVIEQWKELGPAKLYRIGALSQEGRRAILKPNAAPRLQAMNPREFAELTRRYVVERRKVTPEMKAHGLRMKLAAWVQALEAVRLGGITSEEMRAGLLGDLGALGKAAAAVAREVRSGSPSIRGRRARNRP
jgi:hypothetical protein